MKNNKINKWITGILILTALILVSCNALAEVGVSDISTDNAGYAAGDVVTFEFNASIINESGCCVLDYVKFKIIINDSSSFNCDLPILPINQSINCGGQDINVTLTAKYSDYWCMQYGGNNVYYYAVKWKTPVDWMPENKTEVTAFGCGEERKYKCCTSRGRTGGAGGAGVEIPPTECGDGKCEAYEDSISCCQDCGPECGDGACNCGETCESCEADCGPCLAVCGNGILDADEECDDGNKVSGDGCSSTCKKEEEKPPVCGDGTLDADEECDDGNKVSGDGCSSTCKKEYCGDGICDELLGEKCDICVSDCGVCEKPELIITGPEEVEVGDTITYTVTDDEGNPVSGAAVALSDGRGGITGDDGTVTFPAEQEGEIKASAEKEPYIRAETETTVAAKMEICDCKFPYYFKWFDICGIEWLVVIILTLLSAFVWYSFAARKYENKNTRTIITALAVIIPIILALFFLCLTAILITPLSLILALIARIGTRKEKTEEEEE